MMDTFYDDGWSKIYCCHILEGLRQIPDGLVQMVMTSPPYWGLRNYAGGSDIVWSGHDHCEHKWDNYARPAGGGHPSASAQVGAAKADVQRIYDGIGAWCSKCGAWKGQLGLEPTWQLYVQHLVEISREIWRVLRKDGSYYLVLGDTYFGGGSGSNFDSDTGSTAIGSRSGGKIPGGAGFRHITIRHSKGNLVDRPKQKLLIPYRVAMALQEDGWLLRNDITWHKPNSMPSSVKDRLTTTTERIFHFVKQGKYYYDLDAIREPHAASSIARIMQSKVFEQPGGPKEAMMEQQIPAQGGADLKQPSKMVKRLAEQYRKHHRSSMTNQSSLHRDRGKWEDADFRAPSFARQQHSGYYAKDGKPMVDFAKGKNPGDFWEITTQPFKGAHFAVFPEALCLKPILSSSRPGDVVLDPMSGSGTVGVVAKRLGRRAILIDVVESYCETAKKRLERVPMPMEG